jgi:hypothetical protein
MSAGLLETLKKQGFLDWGTPFLPFYLFQVSVLLDSVVAGAVFLRILGRVKR